MVSRGGSNIAASGTPFKKQIDFAILAITRRCHLACGHCYERYNLADQDSVTVRWREVVRELQSWDEHITFSGGEPMLRFEDLLELVWSRGDKDLSDFHLPYLWSWRQPRKSAGPAPRRWPAAGVGLDDVEPDRHEIRCAAALARAQRPSWRSATFIKQDIPLRKRVSDQGPGSLRAAGGLSALRPRRPYRRHPLARAQALWGLFLETSGGLVLEDDRQQATALYREADTNRAYRSYPPIAYPGYEESPGLLGCLMGGLVHFLRGQPR